MKKNFNYRSCSFLFLYILLYMDTNDVLIKIRKIVRSINLESKRIQKAHGVSIPQALCLGYLRESPSYQATQGEIRKYLNLNSSTISGILNRLEMKGYIAKLPKSGDKRVVTIALTSAGDELMEKLPSLLHEQLSAKLLTLSDTNLASIEASLDTLVNLLDIQSIDASPLITIEGELEENEG